METVHNRYISAVKRTPNYEEGLLDLVSFWVLWKNEKGIFIFHAISVCSGPTSGKA
jgi:hypothetical protein